MEKAAARITSWIFSPILVAAFGVLLIGFDGGGSIDIIASFIFLTAGGIFPLVIGARELIKSGSLHLSRERRDNVYIAAVLSFGICTVIFGSSLYTSLRWLQLSMVMAIYFGLMAIVNKYLDKASQHVGMFMLWVMILVEHYTPGISMILVFLPLIMWARISLHKHTWVQIMWGMCIGMGVGLMSWL